MNNTTKYKLLEGGMLVGGVITFTAICVASIGFVTASYEKSFFQNNDNNLSASTKYHKFLTDTFSGNMSAIIGFPTAPVITAMESTLNLPKPKEKPVTIIGLMEEYL